MKQQLTTKKTLRIPKRNQRNHLRFAEFCPLYMYERQRQHGPLHLL
jgi:hypothetical protein